LAGLAGLIDTPLIEKSCGAAMIALEQAVSSSDARRLLQSGRIYR
jgi:hypothetical protein